MENTTDTGGYTLSRPTQPKWRIVVLVWTVLATIAVVQSLVPVALFATPGVLSRDLILALMQLPRYLLWAPLTPLIFAADRKSTRLNSSHSS